MGTGHIMRCLALAQAWQDAGGQPVFAMTESLPALDARLEAERFSIEHLDAAPGSDSDAQQTAQLAGRLSAHWVVLDGYHFDECYERSVKKHGPQLLVMDDYGHGPHTEADLLVNQNLHANGSVYVGPNEHRRLLLGPGYALLRREFIRCRSWKREVPEVASKLLVTLGGTDADNVTLKVIQALEQQSADLETVVVMGD